MDLTCFAATVASGLTGALLGAGGAWYVVGNRAAARRRQLIAAAREQVAQIKATARAAHVRIQGEMEKERATLEQRLDTSEREQREAQARLESQLQAAYAQIDRLSKAGGKSPELAMDAANFALTMPYRR